MTDRKFKIDIVFVLESTGAMHCVLTQFKDYALVLGDMICEAIKASGKDVKLLRLRMVDFADFATEKEGAIRSTDFFEMPAEKDIFEKEVNNIDIEYRGGDLPENGLEALYVAMCSDWVHIAPDEEGRHIIVLLSEDAPLHLGERDGYDGYYKEEYPSSIAELTEQWHTDEQYKFFSLHPSNKRLVLFAPVGTDLDGHSWNPIASWEYTRTNSISDAGLNRLDIDTIIKEIVESI